MVKAGKFQVATAHAGTVLQPLTLRALQQVGGLDLVGRRHQGPELRSIRRAVALVLGKGPAGMYGTVRYSTGGMQC